MMDSVHTFDDLHISDSVVDTLGATPRSGVHTPPSATDLCRGALLARSSGTQYQEISNIPVQNLGYKATELQYQPK
eukprot:scaffold57976_cov56-Attheya_sp.AAC.1